MSGILLEELERISVVSKKAKQLFNKFDQVIFNKPPYNLNISSKVV